jgi:hypothetical protein
MKKTLILLFGIIMIASCNKDQILEEQPSIVTNFVAGSVLNPALDNLIQAKYWVDNTEFSLGNTNNASEAFGVSVTSTSATNYSVYVVGYEIENNTKKARMWRDRIPLTFQTGPLDSNATGIFTTATDNYVSGTQQTASGTQAVYWKNGLRTFLTTGFSFANATAIYVNNSDIYVAGYVIEDGLNKAVYWKNGEMAYLSGAIPEYNQIAVAIVVKNNKVYIAGNSEGSLQTGINNPRYWVDGVIQVIDSPGSKVTSIAVDNLDNVYVAGSKVRGGNPVAEIWKNKIITNFEPNSVNSSLNSIFIKGNIFNKTGFFDNVKATYWTTTNGRMQLQNTTISYGNSVFVTAY